MQEENNIDPHYVYEQRMNRFQAAIRRYQTDSLKNIHDKADKEEEFYVNKIRHDARTRDEDAFRKMEDNVKVAEKIFKSRKVNECRMSEMKVRFDMIQRVQEDAKSNLLNQIKNPETYKTVLKKLIVQGLIKLLEEEVEIRCLKSDENIVSQVMGECQRQFNDMCEVKTKLSINKQNSLTDKDIGGVILTSLNGRIVCDNTLKARLAYCLELLLPDIRKMLFAESDQYLSHKREEKLKQEQKQKASA